MYGHKERNIAQFSNRMLWPTLSTHHCVDKLTNMINKLKDNHV